MVKRGFLWIKGYKHANILYDEALEAATQRLNSHSGCGVGPERQDEVPNIVDLKKILMTL